MAKENEGDLATLAADLKKAAEEVTTKSNETKTIAEKALNEVKSFGKISEETKAAADKLLVDLTEANKKSAALEARFDALEQKAARRSSDEDEPKLKSIGQLFVDDDAAKKLDSSFKGQVRVKMSRKDILNVTGTVGSNTSIANSLVGTHRVGFVMPVERRMTIRDLLMPGETSSNAIEYPRENVFTNAARVVSEGAAKPKSNITFEMETANVRTIAHYFKASRQMMDDVPALRSYIDGRARYGLRYAEEEELLNGDGTGQHLNGIVTQATAYSAEFTPVSPTIIDTIRLAMLQVVLAEFPATGVVLNPIDLARVQLTKDGEGRYIVGNAVNGGPTTLWNLPTVETQAMDEDSFLVGAFSMGAQIFDRMDIEVLLSTENEDDFIKNMVTIRAEERLALAVYRPTAFVTGDFGNVT